MGLQEDFDEAARVAREEIPENIPGEDKLALYGLFKQATMGDNTTSQPGILNQSGRYKWSAWEQHKGKSKEEAMQDYIAKVQELKEKHVK